MKPPRLMNYHCRRLFVFLAVLTFLGCRPAGEESSPPKKKPAPSETAKSSDEQPKELTIDLGSVDSEPKPNGEASSTKPWNHGQTTPEVFLDPGKEEDEKPTETTGQPSEPVEEEKPAAQMTEMEKLEKKIEKHKQKMRADAEAAEAEAAKPDMTPLDEDVAKLVLLQPNASVWIDKDKHRVILVGQVCQRKAPLEMFACPTGTKEHEAVVAIPCQSQFVHAALFAVGAKEGKPVQFHPEYVPASGSRVDIDVRWKDNEGKVHSTKAQEWIRNTETKKPMKHHWVFGGSSFWTDGRTGQEYYSADAGDLICVSNFPSATLDLPIESSQKQGHLLYEAFTENIPPLGTPVTLILKPKLDKQGEKKEKEKTRKAVAFPAITPEG